MNDFWTNISRYPRFFISSLAGLILVILAPFRNLLKIKKLRILVPIAFLVFVLAIYFILKTMTGV
jgi:peptidoglycan/LPS O-acetylase OafA/YrhL